MPKKIKSPEETAEMMVGQLDDGRIYFRDGTCVLHGYAVDEPHHIILHDPVMAQHHVTVMRNRIARLVRYVGGTSPSDPPARSTVPDAVRADQEQKEAVAILRCINYLRSDEGDGVTLMSDNADGEPNCAIDCNGDWTGWIDRRFPGDTLLKCLESAVVAKKQVSESEKTK